MNHGDHLTDRQREYVRHLARGLNSRAAARAAGYSESFSKVAAHRLGKKPEVAQAVAAIRTEGMKMAAYGLDEAMKEAGDAADFAISKGNAMALVKARELRAKLSGLLIDRVEVVNVDLVGSLERAERRVLRVIHATSPPPTIPAHESTYFAPPAALPLPSKTATRWKPTIPGDREPEAGPEDGQATN